ncbi:MAG: glycosyltransferase family 39 protein [Lachnospiraceae bacterium]|nr:glycosyltransferase family 39 protein [Lachnospiraceae bacterium]
MFADLSRKEYCILIILLFAGCTLISYAFARVSKKKQEAASLFIFLNAGLLHVFYIIYTHTWERQHDVIGFRNGKGIGQAALIEYLMNEGHLPDFDPTTRWGFFQPLLHHIVSAVWLKFNLMRGMNYDRACEYIQILTLIYSMVLIFYGFRIFTLMGLKGRGLIISETLLAFHPLLILLSGSVNNDIMSHMFLVMAIYYILKWYRDEKLRDLFLTALTIGLSMMAKLSGVLAAPAVAFLMLYKLIGDIREKKGVFKRIREYALFAVTVFPLGLFFPIRNMILFHVPLTYMPEVGEDLSGYSLIQRIFDIRTATPYTCMIKNGNAYDEFNVFLALIKTGLTGEDDYSVVNPYITCFAWILFFAGAVLFITVVVLFFYVFLRNDMVKEVPIRLFWVILIGTGILFMLRLIFSVPNFSSEDIRYIAWIVVPAAMLPGFPVVSGKAVNYMSVLTGVFAFASAGVYYLLGLP